jgi:hypothetical protein
MQQSHTFASRTRHSTSQSLQKSVPASPKKNFKVFFPLLLKILKHPTHMPTVDKNRYDNRWTEAHAHNKGLPKAGVTGFYDTLVLKRTLVFQMRGSAEMPRLRQAPNRYQ